MKTPLFTQTDFEKWLAVQPVERTFRYSSISDCLIATFLKEHLKVQRVLVGGYDFDLPSLNMYRVSFTDIGTWLIRVRDTANFLRMFNISDFREKYSLTSPK